MSKETYFTRYSLIIKRLERGPANFEELVEVSSKRVIHSGQGLKHFEENFSAGYQRHLFATEH